MFPLVPLVLLFPQVPPQDGVTLYAPLGENDTHLLELGKKNVHTWAGTAAPGLAVYLRKNGNLLRTYKVGGLPGSGLGGSGGGIQEIAWDGTVVWDHQFASNAEHSHHDVAELPNGNLLILVWENLGRAAAISEGRNPAYLRGPDFWSEKILEIETSSGSIVWEWRAWDHLVQDYSSTHPNFGGISDNPQLLNLNFPRRPANKGDWLHCNSINYHPGLDQILVSCLNFNEIWIIDHSTTTAEAAGHSGGNSGKGGDLLYRWGNAQAYDRGTPSDQVFFGQHDANWIPNGYPGAGNILVFNNGAGRIAGPWSSADEISPPVNAFGNYTLGSSGFYGPFTLTWTWMESPPTDFYGENISGAVRLKNGNTLLTNGPEGRLVEVDASGAKVWEWTNPTGKRIFKTRRYERSLWPHANSISANSGGQIEFSLVTGAQHSGRTYWLVGSMSGTTPGTNLPGGLSVPLNRDAFTNLVLSNLNQPMFEHFHGILDAHGLASATLNTLGPISSHLIGRTVWFAFVLDNPWDFASNPVAVQISN